MSETNTSLVREIGRYKIDQFVTADEILKDIRVDPNHLDHEFSRQSSLMYRYGAFAASAAKQAAKMKMILEATESKRSKEIRQLAVATGEKVVETKISSQLDSDPDVIQARKALIEAQFIENMMNSALDGIRSRKETLYYFGRRNLVVEEAEMRLTGSTSTIRQQQAPQYDPSDMVREKTPFETFGDKVRSARR